ncbi:protein phosphatase 1 regulatory subunit 3F-like [Hypanus sabinus]|uniref:protein phosphatase 1 regulatory subunit 3F-like n=1 Tax=Hypanus sabinus TaxID=79690 RepID=UPI0028C4913B|nr:protein phosphatase 1 regulatory subunit 3F-like [Hypanus sabinus]
MSGSALLRVPVPEGGGKDEEGEEEEGEEEDEFKVHLIPRSSPTPRRRDRSCDEAEDPSLSRKVRFADTCGLDLVHLQYYSQFEPLEPLGTEDEEGEHRFSIHPDFALPSSPCQLLERVEEHGVELESIQTLDDPLSVRGLVRVLNLAFQKTVQVRATLDDWATFYDHPAEHVETAADGHTDLFAFVLSFPWPCARPGARLDFVVRYQTPGNVYWANNGGANYSLVCEVEGVEEKGPLCATSQEGRGLRSCLKTTSLRYGERDEDPEELNAGNRDWTNDSETANPPPPGNTALQIPRVQVSQLLTQPLPDGATESTNLPNNFAPAEEEQELEAGRGPLAKQPDPQGPISEPRGSGAGTPGEQKDGSNGSGLSGVEEWSPIGVPGTPPHSPPAGTDFGRGEWLGEWRNSSDDGSDLLGAEEWVQMGVPEPPPSSPLEGVSCGGGEWSGEEMGSHLEPGGEPSAPSPPPSAPSPPPTPHSPPPSPCSPPLFPPPLQPEGVAQEEEHPEGEGETGSGWQEAMSREQGSPEGEGDMAGQPEARAGELDSGEQPDLQSLAALKEVAALASRSLQVLIFLRVAVDSAGSLLCCTLYLLSTFLP